ncbi:MAG: hypothetical protein C5B50_04490 [Verrucomicrobia bacterium]|nr:MAG: hypothetical protein C5B50_04490 [Verrucomicrobiota bacterium]
MCKRPPAAFSLIELLLVVVIILVLTTLYWHSGSANRQQALKAGCQSNLQKLYLALQIYSNEQAGKFPATNGARTAEEPLDLLIPKYTADTSFFICPASADSPPPSGDSLTKHKISYAYFMGWSAKDAQQILMSDKQVDTSPKTVGQAIFSTSGSPPGNNHDKSGGNLLFCDGHTDPCPALAPFAIPVPPAIQLLNPK